VIREILRYCLRKALAFPVKRRLAAFQRATENPAATQGALLRRILNAQAGTAFGRDHRFRDVRTPADFARQVPLAPYEYIEPYVARVRRGEVSALLSEPQVLMFALTSGTTAARKYIPVTPQYLADYRRGWNIWGLAAWRDHKPSILRPIVQLAGDPDEIRAESGVPCGAVSGLTATAQMRIIRRLYCVPASVGRLKDASARYYVALRFALPRHAGMVLAANPSTLIALGRAAETHAEPLIRDIADGTLRADLDIPAAIRTELTRRLGRNVKRARELEEVVRREGRLYLGGAWPSEKFLIGTWTGGSVGPYVRQLPQFYGPTAVRDLGLIASEGRMTLPMADDSSAGVLDVTSHYFEFVPEGEADSTKPVAVAAHEVEEGRNYYIVPTTAYGLYRYAISDLVRVTGFYNGTRTPLVQFLGKGNRFANLTGEKLSEHHVTESVAAVTARLGLEVPVYSLAPVWDDRCPYYGLFVERGAWSADGVRERFLAALDRELGEKNIEYASKRESGRLGPVRMMLLAPGTWQAWDRERLAKCGGPPEQYKHPCLLGDVGFRATVPVEQELSAAALPAAAG
jgi:hypothetical protein